MKCRRARRAIDLRLDDRLELQAGFALDQHLNSCASCQSIWQSALEIEEGLVLLAEPPMAALDVERALGRVRQRIAAAQPPTQMPRANPALLLRAHWRWIVPLGAAASLVGFLFWIRYPGTPGLSTELLVPPLDVANSNAADLPPEPVHPAQSQPTQNSPTQSSPKKGQPATEASEALDNARLARARGEMREILRSAATHLQTLSTGNIEFAQAVDERVLGLRKQSWPVLRISEGLLRDPDPQVSRAAARYLGLRGDRSSLRRLASALAFEQVAESATLGLGDAGDAGIPGLSRALAFADQRELATQLLVRAGTSKAAEALAQALAAQRAETESAQEDGLLDALVAIGSVSLPSLFDLGARNVLSFDELCGALQRIPDSGSFLVADLNKSRDMSRRKSGDLETRVRLAAVFAPHSAGLWLRDALGDRSWKAFCLEEFPRLRGIPGVDALVALDAESLLSTSELDGIYARALELDVERFEAATVQWRQLQVPENNAILARRMLSVNSDKALPVVTALLGSSSLSTELRQGLLLFLAKRGREQQAPLAAAIFEDCSANERLLASHALFAVHQLGGEPAILLALGSAPARTQSNILLLLRRHKAESGTTPSLYKLARELRPLLSSRAQTTRP